MASKQKIIEMLTLVKTIYPYYAKDIKEEEQALLINTWTALLKSYGDDAVTYGFKQALMHCKNPPAPADVIEHIKATQKSVGPSDEELWSIYENALRETYDQMSRFGYTFVESNGLTQGQIARNRVEQIFNSLPDKIRAYLASKSELMRCARDWAMNADFSTYEKARFMKSMPAMEKRIEYAGLLTGNEQWLLRG